MAKKVRDPLDRFYTPDVFAGVVRQHVGELVRVARGDMFASRSFARVIEPSCGTGSYVDACREAGDEEIWGCDIDTGATGISKCNTGLNGDWLVWGRELLEQEERFDLAIGNTPFGGPALGRGRNPGDPAYLGAHHINLCLQLAEVSVFMLPWSWAATPSAIRTFLRPPTFLIPTESRAFSILREISLWVWLPLELQRIPHTVILPHLASHKPRGKKAKTPRKPRKTQEAA